MHATVILGRQGRLVIPAHLRAAWGLAPGDRLHVHLAGGRPMVERADDAVAELRRLSECIPADRSLVDELLSERCAGAAAE